MRGLLRKRRQAAGVRSWLMPVVLISLIVFILMATAYAYMRSSASYRVTIDEVTACGGAASSASYAQPDAAAGQAGTCGYSSSGSYKNYCGVVQRLPDITQVTDWQRY